MNNSNTTKWITRLRILAYVLAVVSIILSLMIDAKFFDYLFYGAIVMLVLTIVLRQNR